LRREIGRVSANFSIVDGALLKPLDPGRLYAASESALKVDPMYPTLAVSAAVEAGR